MSREDFILLGFVVLVIAVFVRVIKKGLHSKAGLWKGILALVGLSVIAIGLHCYLDGDSGRYGSQLLPFQEMGLGVLFLVLASIGCCCGGVNE